jgi:hypothetical protein
MECSISNKGKDVDYIVCHDELGKYIKEFLLMIKEEKILR